jgi:hypothetical protein
MRTNDIRTPLARTRKVKNSPTETFELNVDSVPVEVKATPYLFNDETRFRVSYNGSPVYIFVWDSSLHRLTAISDGSETIPDNIEDAIAQKLQRRMAA